ncbi:HD-GYP domain-containing protein, partial [Marinicrinis lubricantis]
YIVFSTLSDMIIYYQLDETLNRGGIIELFFILFSPIFVNRRFYWFACSACLAKYLYMGMIFQTTEVLIPLGIIIVLTVISYILLMRFITYVDAIGSSYSSQLEAVVKGAVASLELKDRYTKGHSDRVAAYSVIIAKELQKFSQHELNIFYYSCLLHDVGKVQIPDHILCKEGPLTKEEYEIIQTHPAIGADTMESIEGLVMNFEVIRYHHERWDGQGYPEGLVRDETPLLARITSIADAFDAMTSIRSYRHALPPEEAYRRIVEQSGKQFDPALVHVFQRCFPKIIEHYQTCNPHFPETI